MDNPLQKFVENEVKLERLKREQQDRKHELIEWAMREGRVDLFELNITNVFRDVGFSNKRQAVMNMNIKDQ